MNILVVHNKYYYRGGEDTVVDAEASLLRRSGHKVLIYSRDNKEIDKISTLQLALDTFGSTRTIHDIQQIHQEFKPDIIHAHNIFPLISPSLYKIAKKLRIPIVQTLHNFRLLCPQAMLFRDGKACESCIGNIPWRASLYHCYRNSFAQSSFTALAITVHKIIDKWEQSFHHYIVLSQVARDKFIQGGISEKQISIKPNFVESKRVPNWSQRERGIFIGRLSVEKGLDVLVKAVALLDKIKIDVYGTGPLEALVSAASGLISLGFHPQSALINRLHQVAYLVIPSTGIESFGLVAIEAFSCGTPVIASRHGSLAEIIEHGKTGLLVKPGDHQELAHAIAWAESHPDAMKKMGQAAYNDYLERYTPESNYKILMEIYDETIAQFQTLN
jgi:glycosyltransferase involved in cell wall biosynthesis